MPEPTAPLSAVFPALQLHPAQHAMISSLDSLPWRKYPVWIRRHLNPHEDMVVRTSSGVDTEGQVVLRHFANEEFLA